MGNYDYNLAYQKGQLSDFLFTKAQSLDFDKNNALNEYEYSQFQEWFTKEDIKKYSLDTIEFTFKDKVNYFNSKNIPENIKNSDKVSDREKSILKGLNKTAGLGAITGVIATVGMTTIGLKGAIGSIAAISFPVATIAIAVATLAGLGAYAYKNHLENKIEMVENQENKKEVNNEINK